MIVRMRTAATFLLCALVSAPAAGVRADDCMPLVEAGWIRQPPVARPMMAGFATIRNPCTTAVTIVAGGSPAFGSVELHETTQADGVSRMRHVESLEVPAGGSVTLAPGGLHLMLMRPRATPSPGDRLPIELHLADGRRLQVEFQVRAANAH
jgi:periplasmic copper chaperone A